MAGYIFGYDRNGESRNWGIVTFLGCQLHGRMDWSTVAQGSYANHKRSLQLCPPSSLHSQLPDWNRDDFRAGGVFSYSDPSGISWFSVHPGCSRRRSIAQRKAWGGFQSLL